MLRIEFHWTVDIDDLKASRHAAPLKWKVFTSYNILSASEYLVSKSETTASFLIRNLHLHGTTGQ